MIELIKKGDRYDTALVDLEKRQIIDLLPDRDSSTVKKWLIENPGVEIITRDRYSNYVKVLQRAVLRQLK